MNLHNNLTKQVVIEKVNRNNGLPSHQIHNLVFQRDKLWLATPNGLAIHNGDQVSVLTQNDGLLVHGTRSVSNGTTRIIVCSDRGVDIIDDLSNEVLISLDTTEAGYGVCEKGYEIGDSLMLLACTKGLVTWNIASNDIQECPNGLGVDTIQSIYKGHNDSILIFGKSNGLWYYNEGNYKPVTIPEKNKINNITAICFSEQYYWFISNNVVYCVFEDGRFKASPFYPDRRIRNLHKIFPLDSDTFLLSADNALFVSKIESNEIIITQRLLNDIDITDVEIDVIGNLWIASDYSGLFKYPAINQFIQIYKTNKSNAILSIRNDKYKNKLIIGGTRTSYLVDIDNPNENYRFSQLDDHICWDIRQDNNQNYWAATPQGVLYFSDDNDGHVFDYSSEQLSHCRCLEILNDNWILVGSVSGLFLFDIQKKSFRKLLDKECKSVGYTYSINKKNNSLFYICTLGRGLWLLDSKEYNLTKVDLCVDAHNIYDISMSSNGSLAIVADNYLIIQTGQNQSILTKGKGATLAWCCRWIDDEQVLLGTSDGLKIFNVSEKRYTFQVDNYPEDQFWEFTTSRSILKTDKLGTWCGTNESLNFVNLLAIKQKVYPPQIHIQHLKINHLDNSLSNASDKQVTLVSRHQPLEITLCSQWFWAEKSIRYSYRLIGLHKSWIELESCKLLINNLPVGEYVIELKVSNMLNLSTITHQLLSIKVRSRSIIVNLAYQIINMLTNVNTKRESIRDLKRLQIKNLQMQAIIDEKTSLLSSSNMELQKANKALEKLAQFDQLTRIMNRYSFEKQFQREVFHAVREQYNICVMMIDIDYFKQFNDCYGHIEGDKTLYRVAQCLKKSCHRATDLVARYGGEEFIVALIDIEPSDALLLSQKLLNEVRDIAIPHKKSKISDMVTISIGLSIETPSHDFSGDNVANFLQKISQQADEQLYKAKESGRNQVCFNAF